MDGIKKQQFAILMFVMSFTYKVSKLPSLLAMSVNNEALMLAFLYLILELIEFLVVYRLISTDAIDRIRDTAFYKVLALSFLPVFFIKLSLMSAGTVDFTKNVMFENITVYEVIIPLMLVVTYIAIKGVKTVARCAEITIWLILGVLFINLIFLKATPNFLYNLPIVNNFLQLIKTGDKYFFWFGDATPFLFIKLNGGKKKYIIPTVMFCGFMVLLAVALVNAMYGRASQNVGNLIVRVASFNQFADKLGRLDWTGMIVWEILSVLYLSMYLWAFGEAINSILRHKKVWIILCAIFVSIYVTLSNNVDNLIDVAMGNIRWYAVIVNYVVPLIMLIFSIAQKRTEALEVKREQNA